MELTRAELAVTMNIRTSISGSGRLSLEAPAQSTPITALRFQRHMLRRSCSRFPQARQEKDREHMP